VPAPRQLAGGRQREHPGLLCRHEPGWRLGGWGGVASLMWLSPASLYALGPASSAGGANVAPGRVCPTWRACGPGLPASGVRPGQNRVCPTRTGAPSPAACGTPMPRT